MAERVYVHIGTPKSGTTYLQTVLWTNQARLRGQGTLLPGQRRGEHNSAAVWARTPEPARGTQRTWDRLRAQLRGWDGPAILSSEWFTMLDRDLVARFVAELAPAEVHLVLTARNLVSIVPAAWQERLKLGDSLDLDTFVDSLETAENPRWNWGTLDPSVVLPRWTSAVPPSRIHVVTVPPSGSARDLLWRRFADACELGSDTLELDKAFANESISVEGARLLQLIGPELRKAVDADTIGGNLPYRWIRNYFSHQLLAGQPGRKIALTQEDVAMINERSARMVEVLDGGGYQIHGVLQDLTDGANPENSARPELVTDAAVSQLALAAIPEMLGELRRTRERLDRAAAKASKLQRALEEGRSRPRITASLPVSGGEKPGGAGRRRRWRGIRETLRRRRP